MVGLSGLKRFTEVCRHHPHATKRCRPLYATSRLKHDIQSFLSELVAWTETDKTETCRTEIQSCQPTSRSR